MVFNTSIFFIATCVGFLAFFGVYQCAIVVLNHTWLPLRILAAIVTILSVAAILALVVQP